MTTTNLSFQRTAAVLVYGIILTIPVVFGAVHPIVSGFYVFVMMAGLGGWLLLNQVPGGHGFLSFWTIIPLVLIAYLILQSIPLPFEWVEMLSPSRAERVRMVNELAATGQQKISLSDSGIAGLCRSFFLIGVMFYYFTLKRLLDHEPKYFFHFIYCLVAVGLFEALYGLVQFVNPGIGILWLTLKERAAHGTIIYKNQYASLLNMIWPLAASCGALYFMGKHGEGIEEDEKIRFKAAKDGLTPTKVQAPVLIFCAATMMLAVLFSLSRGGILAMCLISLLLLLLLPFSVRGKLAAIIVFICLIGGYGALIGLDTVVSRFATLDRSGGHRLDIYLSSLPMLMDHWWTGIGMGSYSLLSPVYLKGFPENILYDRVHNEYLELMIELGIPHAVMLFGWMLAGMATLFLGLTSRVKRAKLGLGRIVVGIAGFCGLVGFLVHGMIDFGWRLPVNLVYGVTLLAIVVSSLKPQTTLTSNCQEND